MPILCENARAAAVFPWICTQLMYAGQKTVVVLDFDIFMYFLDVVYAEHLMLQGLWLVLKITNQT